MNDKDRAFNYLLANGPAELRSILNNFITLKNKPVFSETLTSEYYILYQLGNQKSLIKVDIKAKPMKFWYYDLLGRPATNLVKDTIARFLWEECGEREKFLQERIRR